jgi:3-oxoacyl-[acyl-carrier protein] reductase
MNSASLMSSTAGPLEGSVALVTGGARDIGAAIVRTLSAQGAAVVINTAHNMSRAESLAAELRESGARALAVQADVTDAAAIDDMLARVRDIMGATIHILVNNAGGLVARKTMEAMDVAFWREVIDLNLTSVFAVTKAVLPMMADGGAIVNLSSLAARDGGGGGALAYSSAKGAVLTFTRGLAKELAPRRIRVNCVSPGLIATTFHDTFTAPAVRQAVAGRTAVGREGSAQDVANAVAFLASPSAAYITGESLEINGGLYFV